MMMESSLLKRHHTEVLVSDILSLALDPFYQDVSIICRNGECQCNSLLLASMFSKVFGFLLSMIHTDEQTVISMPDLDKDEFSSSYLSFLSKEHSLKTESEVSLTESNDEDNCKKGYDNNSNEEVQPIQISLTKKSKTEKVVKKKLKKGKLKQWKCFHCGQEFVGRKDYSLHKREAHPDNEKFQCSYCGKYFAKLAFKTHVLRIHQNADDYVKCSKSCRIKFSKDKIEEHEAVCGQGSNLCNVCGKSFKLQSSVFQHIQRFHVEKEVTCTVEGCGKVFQNEIMLKGHMDTHEVKAPCPKCGALVKKLKHHIATVHTKNEDKPFQCQDCGKGFPTESKVKQHRMSVHLKIRPYNCRYGCDIAYNDMSNRNSHERKRHGGVFDRVRNDYR